MQRVAGIVLLFSAAAAQAASSAWDGSDGLECRDQSTLGIVSCTAASTKRWDGRLNRAYKALMARLSAEQKQALRSAQREWIKYRDANCGFYATGEGSIRRIEAAECLRVMTKERTLELEQDLEKW